MAFNKAAFIDNLKGVFDSTFKEALKHGLTSIWPTETKEGNTLADTFANEVTTILKDSLCEQLASAVETAIKNMDITGKIVMPDGKTAIAVIGQNQATKGNAAAAGSFSLKLE